MALLDRQTLNKVKKLCKASCCNYIDRKCIFTDSTCDYFEKYGGSISCDWFEKCVLPSDKDLEQAYKEQHGIIYIEKSIGKYSRTCKACSVQFKTDSRNVLTCSDACRSALRKESKGKHYLGQS